LIKGKIISKINEEDVIAAKGLIEAELPDDS